jgi:hypothetical protein
MLERRQVGGPHRSVFRAAPVEPAVQLVQFPVNGYLVVVHAFRQQADYFAPARPGICHIDIHHDISILA